jgi:hypothetical protein
MNNTAHFGLDSHGHLVSLGVGPDNKDTASNLADLAESVANANGNPIFIGATFNIPDLYQLIREATDALNSLDNDALTAPAVEDVPIL